MHKINLKSSNSKMSMLATIIVLLIGIIIFLIPLLVIKIFPQSTIGSFLINNINYSFVILPIIIYILKTGFYFYFIKIDAYIMHITSYRSITGLLTVKNYIEVPHDMLEKYSFFNRPYTVNKTLMIKIKDVNGKRIIKRFNCSFISKKEEQRISIVFDKIIAKNKL